MLKHELMPKTHPDHKPTTDGVFLVLNCVEGPAFIKRGTSKTLRTGVKLQVQKGYLAFVAQRVKHGNGYQLANPVVYTASSKLGEDGKPVANSDGEGMTGEISVLVSAPSAVDLNVRLGEAIAVGWLVSLSAELKLTEGLVSTKAGK